MTVNGHINRHTYTHALALTKYQTYVKNNRLQKEKAKLIEEHGSEGVKIEKGKLYHNNAVKDQFDLGNQLF